MASGTRDLAVLWFSAYLSILRQRVSQNYVNVVTFICASAIFVMGLAGGIWLLDGNPSATSFASEDGNPFVYSNLTTFSFAVLALLGIEVPLNMGVEIKSDDSIKHYLFWGAIVFMVAYQWATWANMVVGNPEGYDFTTGGPLGVSLAIGEGLGKVVAPRPRLVLPVELRDLQLLLRLPAVRLRLGEAAATSVRQGEREQGASEAVLLQTVLASIITNACYFVFGELTNQDVFVPFFALYAAVAVIWHVYGPAPRRHLLPEAVAPGAIRAGSTTPHRLPDAVRRGGSDRQRARRSLDLHGDLVHGRIRDLVRVEHMADPDRGRLGDRPGS